jgi:hypothetical protein
MAPGEHVMRLVPLPLLWVVVEAAPDVDNFLTAAEAAAGKEQHHQRNAALKYIEEISLAL